MSSDWLAAPLPGEEGGPLPDIDTSVAHIARVYDYWLGGKDNFAPDRAAAEAAMREDPNVVEGVRGNRAFLARAVRYLVGQAGIRQFLDIGTGIPAADNTHEVAQDLAPECRVVYVDNDPIVLAHARALLTSEPEGATAYLDQDLRNVAEIVPAAAGTLNFSEPVAVMLIGILHCIPDEDDPAGIVKQLMDAVPPGSYLAISHPASDINDPGVRRLASRLNELMPMKLRFRSRAEVAVFFDGLELVEPGLVRVPEWRPGAGTDVTNPAALWGGVARKN
ncbi:MAG TPA: SAM-dependent methyltransferase [Streptosporangiaceae bacterium]|nr:SAM-dependent methyltransferase [Streptosporangiaceae bacterium]